MLKRVKFPPENHPGVTALYALNEIDVKAPAEVVWQLLVEAENWSSYFPPEDQVRILGGDTELKLGTRYSRITVGFSMSCVVREYVPFRSLSWSTTVDGDETGSTAFHGWVITPTEDGCHLLTEETLQGAFFLEEIGRKNPGALYKYHQDWVEMLARAAEAQAAS
ncbi:ATPase [Phyllobacterium phragmitis]|uniref:ATPase n=1 Tax=Phyllobacterium phragmitis TaxID=2670329 RepID=A0A2S9IQ01_9HYPH|nr:SRPBCC family protein [Phyllobacterium phragmitis]PRD42606.1 ATPase [Phyllobacterium phragmitis]